MKLALLFLAICTLGLVKSGAINWVFCLEGKALKDFDRAKIAGDWYLLEAFVLPDIISTNCIKATYEVGEENYLRLKHSGNHTEGPHNYVLKPLEGPQVGKYQTFTRDGEDYENIRITYLRTDYDNYLMTSVCFGIENNKIKHTFKIYGRTTQLPETTLKPLREELYYEYNVYPKYNVKATHDSCTYW